MVRYHSNYSKFYFVRSYPRSTCSRVNIYWNVNDFSSFFTLNIVPPRHFPVVVRRYVYCFSTTLLNNWKNGLRIIAHGYISFLPIAVYVHYVSVIYYNIMKRMFSSVFTSLARSFAYDNWLRLISVS